MQSLQLPTLQVDPNEHKSLQAAAAKLERLISELNKKSIPEPLTKKINLSLEGIGAFQGSHQAVAGLIRKVYRQLLTLVRKELGLVPKYYYRSIYLSIGIAAFGLPVGLLISVLIKNFAFIGIGLPVGLTTGMAIGNAMDAKAQKENKQLNITP